MRRIWLLIGGLALVVVGAAGPASIRWFRSATEASSVFAAPPGALALEVVEQGFDWVDPGLEYVSPWVRWVVVVHNPNPDTWVVTAEVHVTFRDAAGAVMGDALGNLTRLQPGETGAVGYEYVELSWPAAPATMDVELLDPYWTDVGAELPGQATVTTLSTQYEGGELRVVAEVRSTIPADAMGWTEVAALLRGADGRPLGALTNEVATSPDGAVGVEFMWTYVAPGATVELFATRSWSASEAKPAGVAPLEVLEVGGDWYGGGETYNDEMSWGALLRNPNGSGWIADDIEVTATFRDANGTIIGAQSGYATSALPGQTVAVAGDWWYSTNFTLDGLTSVEVTANTNYWLQLADMPDWAVVFDDVSVTQVGDSWEMRATMRSEGEEADPWVTVIYRDGAGSIVAGSELARAGRDTESLAPGASVAIEDTVWANVPDIATAELYVHFADPAWEQPTSAAERQFREPDTLVPEFTTYIPTPMDVSVEPPVVGANLLLAGALMVLFAGAAELANKTLARGELVIERVFPPARWARRAQRRADRAMSTSLHRRTFVTWLRLAGIFIVYGVIFSFLEPDWDPLSVSGLFVVVSLAIAFGLVGVSPDMARWRAARQEGLNTKLDLRPANLLLAIGSAGLSRLLGLLPGVFFGAPEAFESDERDLTPNTSWRLVRAEGLTAFVVAGTAWLATILTDRLLGADLPRAVLVAAGGVQTVLLLIFAVAVENLFQEMLGLPGSMGAALHRRSRLLWLVALVATAFALWQSLVNPNGDLAQALSTTDVRLFLVTGGVFVVGSVVLAALVERSIRRHPDLPPPTGRPVLLMPPSDWAPPTPPTPAGAGGRR